MKFLKVSAYYNDFVNEVYERHPQLHNASYDQQIRTFFDYRFAWADFWKIHLEETGKFDAVEIVFNLKPAQVQWAKQHGVSFRTDNWRTDILDAQIEFFKPEIVFFEDLADVPASYRKKFPFIKYIITWDGIANQNPAMYEGADVIASCHKPTVDFYKKNGVNSFYFMFGFETSILKKIEVRKPLYDVSFVGSVNVFKNGHRQRLTMLSDISRAFKPDYWLSGTGDTSLFSRQQVKRVAKGMIPEIFRLHRVSKFNHGKAFGVEMYQILSDSKITLNSHIDAAGQYAANIRLFEATGAGTCLLTDWKKNLHEIFEIDKEVVAYKSTEECIEKAKWLLDNEQERRKIAQAGQQRTLNNYSLKKRIVEFTEYLGL
jgi:spore maturation protein CgeB